MHGQLFIHITICIELLVFLAGLGFLAKVKKDSLGKIYRILTCAVLTIVALVLICTLWLGISRMCCHNQKGECTQMEMEKCTMDGKGMHKMMMMRGGCDGMDDCHGMMKGECGEMEGGHEGKMENCPYDKNGKCMGDESKCKEMEKGCDMKDDGKASKDSSKKMEMKKK